MATGSEAEALSKEWLRDGCRIALTGLSSEDLNGQIGSISGSFLADRGRWPVVVDESGRKLSCKPSNLTGLASCGHCGAEKFLDALKKCTKCLAVHYCDAACQSQHWKRGGHKQACREQFAFGHYSPVALEKQTAVDLLGLMIGADLTAAIQEAFTTNTFAGLLDVLPTSGNAHACSLHQAAFKSACNIGRTDIATVLLGSANVDPNQTFERDSLNPLAMRRVLPQSTVLQHAIADNQASVVRLLVAHDEVDVNFHLDDCLAPLALAALGGQADCMQALLTADGIYVNQVSGYGNNIAECFSEVTALVLACGNPGIQAGPGHHKCASLLLAVEGIDVHGQAAGFGDCSPPLFCAVGNHNVPCVMALLAVPGIDVNLAEQDGATPLSHACKCGYLDIVTAILATKGVDANILEDDASGFTPLHAAVLSSCTQHGADRSLATVRVLLTVKNIDINVVCTYSEACTGTPLHMACRFGEHELVQALLLGGACRFKGYADRPIDPCTPQGPGVMSHPDVAQNEKVRKVFLSGADYWQRKHHAHHSWAMKQVVMTLLLVGQRLDYEASNQPDPTTVLPEMPEEIWLSACGFLRSADFSVARGK